MNQNHENLTQKIQMLTQEKDQLNAIYNSNLNSKNLEIHNLKKKFQHEEKNFFT